MERLSRRLKTGVRPRVWCWDDLWNAVRTRSRTGPIVLSAAATRAVLGEAVSQAKRDGVLDVIRQVVDAPGFRRKLQGRIAAWTRIESDPDQPPPEVAASPLAGEEWAVFTRYRAILSKLGKPDKLGALDPEALTAWASRTLLEVPPPDLRRFSYVAVLDPTQMARARWRALEHFEERSIAVLATLPYDPDPALSEAYASVAPIRDSFIKRKYTETAYSENFAETPRPPGLRRIEQNLFRNDNNAQEFNDPDGLQFLGAPEGDGIGLAAARWTRDLLAKGVDPDNVLVLVPRRDEQAALIVETMQAWGLPASAGWKPPLTAEPAVSALRLAVSIPVKRWDTSRIIRLLRNSRIHPAFADNPSPLDLAAAATAIQETRVFRGRNLLLDALRRAAVADLGRTPLGDDRRQSLRAARARDALKIIEPLTAALNKLDQAETWQTQVAKLRALADRLDLDRGDPALQHLGHALDDHGEILDRLHQGGTLWTWPEFVEEVNAIVKACPVAPSEIPSGVVRVATVDQVDGLRARHVLLANLGEGAFPSRDAVLPDPGAPDDPEPDSADRSDLAFAREMLRFLRVAGSAEETLTFVYPTTDVKGQDLLAAGFLDDVRRLFNKGILDSRTETINLLGGVLDASLAGAPAEARVRAVSLACQSPPGVEELQRLARSSTHRFALEGAASAFLVAHERSRERPFGRYEGMLADVKILQKIKHDFGPGRPAFSPTQLESLAFCPFQFYLGHVLRLQPIDDRDELDDDRATRGSVIHQALENLHRRLHDSPPDGSATTADHVANDIEDVLIRVVGEVVRSGSEIEPGRTLIERGQLVKIGRRYALQYARYAARVGIGAVEHQFEVTFGNPKSLKVPSLVFGQGLNAVPLQGQIDRIDLVEVSGCHLFRIIDYKTGHAPSKRDVEAGLALQLPLYALAVERLTLAGEAAGPVDVGYWALASKGYQSVKTMIPTAKSKARADQAETWETFRQDLETYVLSLVAHLRAARFPIAPRSEDCTRICDFSAVCRIKQVRTAEKVWADAPRLESSR